MPRVVGKGCRARVIAARVQLDCQGGSCCTPACLAPTLHAVPLTSCSLQAAHALLARSRADAQEPYAWVAYVGLFAVHLAAYLTVMGLSR